MNFVHKMLLTKELFVHAIRFHFTRETVWCWSNILSSIHEHRPHRECHNYSPVYKGFFFILFIAKYWQKGCRFCKINFFFAVFTIPSALLTEMCTLVQSEFQSGPKTVLLGANPTWASKIWPCVHAKSDRFLSILD